MLQWFRLLLCKCNNLIWNSLISNHFISWLLIFWFIITKESNRRRRVLNILKYRSRTVKLPSSNSQILALFENKNPEDEKTRKTRDFPNKLIHNNLHKTAIADSIFQLAKGLLLAYERVRFALRKGSFDHAKGFVWPCERVRFASWNEPFRTQNH